MIAVVTLAGCLIVAVSCAMTSVQSSVELGISKTIGAADARIVHQAGGRFDESVLQTVRQWPEVKLAVGRIGAPLTLMHADRRAGTQSGQPMRETPNAQGVDLPSDRQLRTFEWIAGRDIQTPDEIVLDPIAAEKLQAKVGDQLVIQRLGPPIPLRVAGIFNKPIMGALQRPEVQVQRSTLGDATGRAGQLTTVVIQVRESTDVEKFCAAHQDELPPQLLLEPAEKVRSGFDRRVMASRLGMTFASVLAFMSAAFIIITGLTTAITERQREMAMVRCIGGSRGQLFASQLWIGLIIGSCGAILAAPIGIAMAAVLVWWFGEFLESGLRISLLGMTLSVIGALSAGLIGALYPAWVASRVSPLRAMSVAARPVRLRHVVICTIMGLMCVVLQMMLLLLPGDEQSRFWAWIIAGLPVLFVGYFLLAVPILQLVAAAAGPLLSRALRLPPRLLLRSVRATPFRHGFTAGALMVAMSVLVGAWSTGSSILDDWLGRMQFADAFAINTSGITPEQQRAIAALPFVESVCPLGHLQVQVVGRHVFGVRGLAPPNITAIGFDPDQFFKLNTVRWLQGDPQTGIARLKQGDAVVVAQQFLEARQIGVGDRLRLKAGRVEHEFEVVGVVEFPGLDIVTQMFAIRSLYMEYAISGVGADFRTLERVFDSHDALMMQVDLSDSVTDEQATKAVTASVPGVRFISGRFIKQTINDIATTVLSLYSAVAFAALVIACLGVANIIIANVHSRQFEFGVIRAMGGQRGLLLRLILGEVMLIGLGGCITGSLLGLHIAAVSAVQYHDLIGINLRVPIPVIPMLIGAVVMLLMTVLAALPAAVQLMNRSPRVLLATGRAA